jgi:dienelactone hydrolase
MTDIDLSDLAADRDGSRPLRGYLASPAGTGPWPAVVMIREIFGCAPGYSRRGHGVTAVSVTMTASACGAS